MHLDSTQQTAQPPAPTPSIALSLTVDTAAAAAEDDTTATQPCSVQQRCVPPTSSCAQPTSTNRLEASHAEDVLTLSLELERVRSQLAATTSQLETSAERVGYLETQNDHLGSELAAVRVALENSNACAEAERNLARERLEKERARSEAASEDAALALELAKESQAAKEECEMWLSRSLEELDLWRGRVGGLERALKEQQEARMLPREEAVAIDDAVDGDQAEGGQKKSVRFKEDCPPSPVVSEDGGYDENAAVENASPLRNGPPLPTAWSPSNEGSDSIGQGASKNDGLAATAAADSPNVPSSGMDGVQTGIFSPDVPCGAGVTGGPGDAAETPSKADLVTSGRAILHHASPSPLRHGKNGLSPHPRQQASELLKKSAATRRLLRERLTPGYNGAIAPPPPPAASLPRTASDPALGDDERGRPSFADRQGAACKAIGRIIRDSGARLQLDGPLLLANGSPASEPMVIEGVAQLESMVKVYCGSVEGTIGQQREKIDELHAFCDHLEKEIISSRE